MAPKDLILTIAIPTYNRPDKLKNTLLNLLPQLSKEVCVNVLDNCSDINVQGYFENETQLYNINSIKFIRHRINIGADANFQRCFEICETPYIWVLGDDDQVEDNAVAIILSEIKIYGHLDLVGINFKSNILPNDRTLPIIIRNTQDLSEKLDHFGNWLFISTTIYKTTPYCKYLNQAMYGAYAMSSQIVPAMIAISNNIIFVLSEKYLVSNVPEEADKKWSDIQLALGITSLLEIQMNFNKDEYKGFAKNLSTHFNSIRPGGILASVLNSIHYNVNLIDNYHIYIYKQIMLKNFEFRTSKIKQMIQYYGVLILLNHKWMIKFLLHIWPGIRARAERSVPFKLFIRQSMINNKSEPKI